MKGTLMLLAVLALGLLIGAALGLMLAPRPPPTSTTAQTAATPAEARSLCPVSVDAIKQRGKLIVATDPTWPPWEWVSDGKIVGWDVDIAREIANALGVQLEVRDLKWPGPLESARAGLVDLAISAITWTPEREQVLEFSMPYYQESIVVMTLASRADIRGVQDLYGKTVGVQVGTTHDEWASEHLEKPGRASVRRYDKMYPYMVEALVRGDVDAIILDRSIATALTRRFSNLKVAFEIPGTFGYISVAMPKCAQDLKLVVDRVIYNLTQTGRLEEIFRRNSEAFLSSAS